MKIERIAGSEPHSLNSTPAALMKWSVLWYNPDKDTIKRIPCGNDLNEAIRVFSLAKGKREMVTLRCDNYGWPPPKKYQPHSVYVVTQEKYQTPRGKWKYREKRVARAVVPLEKANRKGIYWCPYCREMRRFQLQHKFYIDGRMVPDPDRRGGLYCPMCGVSHRDFHVRRWNPLADRHYLTGSTGRRSSGSR